MDDQVCVFKWDSINDAIGTFPEVFEREKEKNYYIGVDIAKMHDYTTIYVVDGTDQKSCRVVFTERFNNKPYSYIVDRVLAVAANFQPLRIVVDETGVGAGLTEQILSKAPMTEGFKFSMPAKIELINTLKTGLEQRRLKFSHDNVTLTDELRYYQYEISEETGGIKMNAPSGKHDDCVIALALAYWKCAVIYADAGVTLIPAQGKALNTAETSVLNVQDPGSSNDGNTVVVV